MPRGDCTGPFGTGSRWAEDPSEGRGFGRGEATRGHPWRGGWMGHGYWSVDRPTPGWAWNANSPLSKREELTWFRHQADWLKERLEAIHGRIEELSQDQPEENA